jgi:hypothetical protein
VDRRRPTAAVVPCEIGNPAPAISLHDLRLEDRSVATWVAAAAGNQATIRAASRSTTARRRIPARPPESRSAAGRREVGLEMQFHRRLVLFQFAAFYGDPRSCRTPRLP